MPPHQVVMFIIGTVVVLFGAYYVTYFVGMKASGRTRAAGFRNRNIKLLDQFSIARDKSFCVVEVAGKVYVVGVTANSMTMLDKYGLQEFEELTMQDGDDAQIPWANTPVGQYGNKLTKKVVAFVAAKMGKQDELGVSSEELRVRGEETGVRNEELGIKGEETDGDKKKLKFSDSMKKAEEANNEGAEGD